MATSNTNNAPATVRPRTAAEQLEAAAVYNVSQRDSAAKGKTVKVLAGYRVVNTNTGHMVVFGARDIRAEGDKVVGLKAGFRLATAEELANRADAAQKGS